MNSNEREFVELVITSLKDGITEKGILNILEQCSYDCGYYYNEENDDAITECLGCLNCLNKDNYDEGLVETSTATNILDEAIEFYVEENGNSSAIFKYMEQINIRPDDTDLQLLDAVVYNLENMYFGEPDLSTITFKIEDLKKIFNIDDTEWKNICKKCDYNE